MWWFSCARSSHHGHTYGSQRQVNDVRRGLPILFAQYEICARRLDASDRQKKRFDFEGRSDRRSSCVAAQWADLQ